MKLIERVDKLEALFAKHLEESGEIRSDLKWLKGAFWGLVGICTTGVGALITVILQHAWR